VAFFALRALIAHTQHAPGLATRDRALAPAEARAATTATAPALHCAARRSLSVMFFALEARRSYTPTQRASDLGERDRASAQPTREQLPLLLRQRLTALGVARCRRR